MNLFAITSLAVSVCCFGFAIFTFVIAKTKLHKIWGIFNVIIATWGLNIFLAGISTAPEEALIFWKLAYLPCTFISIVFYHVIVEFCGIKRPKMLSLAYIQGISFIPLIIYSEYFIGSTFYLFDSIHYHKATLLFSIWLLMWFIITGSAFFELYRFIKESQGIQKTRALYLFWAMLLGHTGGTTTAIPSFNIPTYPIWHFMICIYAAISTYAVFKYQMMEISIVIKKSAIYSISIATISLLYLLSVFSLEKFAQEILDYHSLTISIGIAFILGLLFIPIRQRIHRFMDRYFFQGSTEEIANQNEQLRQEIAQSEKYKTLTTLATGIAHEVKNPLTAIRTFTEYLPHKLNDKEFLTKFSNIVGREVERIDDMTHQLLDYGKPAPLALKRTDINKLIEDSVDILNSKFIVQKILVHKNLTQKGRLLDIDPNQIKQVLLNIFLNSIDSMPHGGQLTISSFVDRRSTFVITIEDTGGGIPKEDLSQVFDPFFSKKDSGTGLGLSITQSLIENHKGTIHIKSKIGVGTSVRINLLY